MAWPAPVRADIHTRSYIYSTRVLVWFEGTLDELTDVADVSLEVCKRRSFPHRGGTFNGYAVITNGAPESCEPDTLLGLDLY